MRGKTAHTVLVIVAVLAVLLAAAAAFVASGVYNVAATRQHTPPLYHLMYFAMRQSVKAHAAGILAPQLADVARADRGFPLFRAHCVQCHGAPGTPPDAVAFGLLPLPPNLAEVARTWPPAELYWVVANGIKMTAMPAWRYRLSDAEIWDIVAFIKRLPAYSPQEYQALARSLPAPAGAPFTEQSPASAYRAGDARAGQRALNKYLCASCHRIPGVTGADKAVGPPLDNIARRSFIAGTLPNTPDNMALWLQHPQRIKAASAMPELAVTDADARDMAAYLGTLTGEQRF